MASAAKKSAIWSIGVHILTYVPLVAFFMFPLLILPGALTFFPQPSFEFMWISHSLGSAISYLLAYFVQFFTLFYVLPELFYKLSGSKRKDI